MNHELLYPILHCHFCNHVMLYTRYDNGGHSAYCNNPRNSGCMSFAYNEVLARIEVSEFIIFIDDISLKVKTDRTNVTFVTNYDGSSQRLENSFDISANIILDKDKSIKLMNDVKKRVMLMGFKG